MLNSTLLILGSSAAAIVYGLVLIKMIMRPDQIVITAGYASLPHIIAILTCIIFRIPFALWTDQFNIGNPEKGLILKLVRDPLRRLIFRNAFAIMVGGKPGLESAIRVGCPPDKLLDFPYVIDPERFRQCQDMKLPIISEVLNCAGNRGIVFFSGRLIHRKGLDVLLRAISSFDKEGKLVFLIIEGEGLLREEYKRLSEDLGIDKNCKFVGFKQMSEHSSLLAISDIVVVPSIHDNWGIVVHEGQLMGKPVIASNRVGSAIDRISHGENGYIFEAGDHLQLAYWLKLLSNDKQLRECIGNNARLTAERYSPEHNVELFLKLINSTLN